MRVLGVDGCKGGWIGVWLDRGRFVGAVFSEQFGQLVEREKVAVVAVDIPIGLGAGRLRADKGAKELLAGRGSTLFQIPPRRVLAKKSHAAACAEAVRLKLGWKPSQQAYNLGQKIFEVEGYLRRRKTAAPPILESHPELAFARIAGKALSGKKTWNGVNERLRLLRGTGISVPPRLDDACNVATDDILDAAVMAWVASNIARSEAVRVPEDAPVGACAIWY